MNMDFKANGSEADLRAFTIALINLATLHRVGLMYEPSTTVLGPGTQPIFQSDFDAILKARLSIMGYRTLGHLAACTADDLKANGFNDKDLSVIRDILSSAGLCLRDEPLFDQAH